jgi:hypothetical protein
VFAKIIGWELMLSTVLIYQLLIPYQLTRNHIFSALPLVFLQQKTRKFKKSHVPNTSQTAVKALISSFAGLESV